MAIAPCRECGKEISTEATTCPNCGAARRQTVVPGCLGWAAIAVFVLFVVGVISSSLRDNARIDADYIDACVQAHFAIKERLKAPATAEFSDCTEVNAKKQPDGTWGVAGYVDSQNSFGAMIRSQWVIQMRPTPAGQWTVIKADIVP